MQIRHIFRPILSGALCPALACAVGQKKQHTKKKFTEHKDSCARDKRKF